MYIDIFNGDADGILSLIQLRKALPVASDNHRLITGVKRDISLCKNISNQDANDAVVTVLDISYDKNYQDIERLLECVSQITYFDHHQADKLISNPKLKAHINTSADICTALIVSSRLDKKYHLWAIVAAYGDNLHHVADSEADLLKLKSEQKAQLKELGMLINYNGYGSMIDDLYYHPADLYHELMKYETPFEVIADKHSCFYKLRQDYENDSKNLDNLDIQDFDELKLVKLPDQPWARRVSGTLGNDLVNKYRDKAIIIATTKDNGNYLISLRAPKNKPFGAADICSQFATGGGREAAAGINDLLKWELDKFVNKVQRYYG
ncbi:DHH family phosphoesterase [Francisella philomiragia]|uniref:Acetyltransferase n=1 Tax=Francisella philomiragia TaxID=28110 RepID=A0AAW3D9Y3_9GAMM|nr:DHH family phosphoesterase [Francisella philomiragia]KFJ42265.1 putative acetyltransferase [Francisella philomiragia]MBK2255667.1 DHH family phosphoesterase [Francisella philomiragia]MBK2273994.1 DHH family phosphoesterase [Francisella philomiragia]MBK2277835.1 DHH family phosphoesterase [Francisella philomiragia]MBK2281781.1 DHH family phosphoesterase [Francisella philomiragia]